MRNTDTDPKQVQVDTKKLEDKLGECSVLYAQERSKAAKLAGDEAEARHWQEVAEMLGPDDDR